MNDLNILSVCPFKPFQRNIMFACKAGAYPSKVSFGYYTLGWLLVLPANIRLGRKCLPSSNTLAYYEHEQITDVKSFITLGL